MIREKLSWTYFLSFLFIFLASQVVIVQLIEILDILLQSHLMKIFTKGYIWLVLEAAIFSLMIVFSQRIRQFLMDALNLSVLKAYKTYVYVFIGFLIYLFLQYLLIDVLEIGNPSEKPEELGVSNSFSLFEQVLFILSIGIITPIKEELIFRGTIHRFFEVNYAFWVGLIVSSIVFGSLHFGYAILATITGVGFVLLYKATNSLAAPILLHIAWNIFGVIILLYV